MKILILLTIVISTFVHSEENNDTIVFEAGVLSGLMRVNNNLEGAEQSLENTSIGINPSVFLSFYKKFNDSLDIGVGAGVQQIEGQNLYIIKAIDTKFTLFSDFKMQAAFGAGNYQLASPSMGYIAIVGFEYDFGKFHVNLDYQFADHLSRDQRDETDVNLGIASFSTISAWGVSIGFSF